MMYGKCELAKAERQTTAAECIISFQVQLHQFRGRGCRHNRVFKLQSKQNIMHLALKASQQLTDYIVYSRAELAKFVRRIWKNFAQNSRSPNINNTTRIASIIQHLHLMHLLTDYVAETNKRILSIAKFTKKNCQIHLKFIIILSLCGPNRCIICQPDILANGKK